MNPIIELEATVTERGQTTVPAAVRKALGLAKAGRIRFVIGDGGAVSVLPAGPPATDAALEPFIALLASDLRDRPEAILPLDAGLLARAEALTAGMSVDLDAPIGDDAE